MTVQCSTLEDKIKKLDASFVDIWKKKQEKKMMHFVIEGNTLKTKRKEKVKQMFVLKNHVDKLQIKKKKLV